MRRWPYRPYNGCASILQMRALLRALRATHGARRPPASWGVYSQMDDADRHFLTVASCQSGHSGRSKFLQVLGNEHWARKVLLHLVRPLRIIIVRFPRQMAQDHGLYSGARG